MAERADGWFAVGNEKRRGSFLGGKQKHVYVDSKALWYEIPEH
jgi:hypothetical protein